MTKQTASKVPQIRFKGFEAEWEEKTLGQIADVYQPQTISQRELTTTGFNVYGANGIIGKYSRYNHKEPQIAVTCRGNTCGTVNFTKGQSWITGNAMVVNVDENELVAKLFLFQQLSAQDLNYLITGSGQPQITGTIKSHKTWICHPAEQTKIAKYLRELDSLIGLHQRKHDKLVTLKKAMLQKMFPQAGATSTEVRFLGFSGEWVEKPLHYLAGRYDNLRIPVTASNRIPGITPYYGANGIQDYVQGYTHEGEFILVAEDGANDLKNYPIQYVSGKVWVNNHAHVLQGKDGLAETRFLKYAFSQINVEMFLVGGGRAKLNAETMMQMELCVPTDIAEQQKIGTYFRQLDALISKHAVQLQKLKQLKSACLEKMFV